MFMRFRLQEGWPPLAWLATCDRTRQRVLVDHGPNIEVKDTWFCEAVWAGEFFAGEFDRTDLIVGSGARLRGDRVVFVSSGTTVDRLQLLETTDGILVSNSLPCLMQAADATVDPTYPHYYRDFRSIIHGLARYKQTLETNHGPVSLVYFRNVVWNGTGYSLVDKPGDSRRFESFDAYRDFLVDSLHLLGRNMVATDRQYVLRSLGTVSTGYDSPAVATLARNTGLEEVLTFRRARDGTVDDGGPIAERLGLRVISSDREAWRSTPGSLIPFCATNAYGEEVHYSPLADTLSGRVLFTGYHGDKAWAKDTKDLGPDIVRGDPTGLSLSEFRLWASFIHCPLPFFGIRQIADLNRISNSSDMSAWDIAGDYSRPIPRRLTEEAGVPRDMFGIAKRASSVTLWNRKFAFLPPEELERLQCWITDQEHEWSNRSVVSPLVKKRREGVQALLAAPLRPINKIVRRVPVLRDYGHRIRRLDPYHRPDPLFHVLFPYALDRAKTRYGKGGGVS